METLLSYEGLVRRALVGEEIDAVWHRWYAWYPVHTLDAGWQWRTEVLWRYPQWTKDHPWAMEEIPPAEYRREAEVSPKVQG